MIESKEFQTSDGTTYRVTMFGAQTGQKLLHRVARVVVPALGRAADGAMPVAGDIDVMVGPALDKLCDGLSPELLEDITKAFSEKTEVNTEGDKWVPLKGRYDDHFAGRYVQLLEWVRGCFEVNYADFFGVFEKSVKDRLSEAVTAKIRRSSSQPTSKPTSTESP